MLTRLPLSLIVALDTDWSTKCSVASAHELRRGFLIGHGIVQIKINGISFPNGRWLRAHPTG